MEQTSAKREKRKSLLRIAIPIILSSCLQISYDITDMFWVGKLGSGEVAVLRKSSDRVIRLQQSISVPVKTSKMLSKTERDKIAVDMYNNGYSVNEIMAHCNVKSKSTVYQILGKYNVALSRKPGRVPGNRK